MNTLGQERIYINGRKMAEGFRPGGFDSWNDSYSLRLGNSQDENHSWQGTYYLVAVYNRALTEREIKDNYQAGPMDDINNNDFDITVNLFPNPARDYINLEMIPNEDYDRNEKTLIRIVDINGVKQYEELVFNPSQYYIKSLPVKHLSKGMYLVQITQGNTYKSVPFVLQ
jgi:hypothetical protein